MCGRFTLRTPPRLVAEMFGLHRVPEYPARYNIAPTQDALGVRLDHDRNGREAALFRWGLIPSWAKDPAIGNGLINARSETAATKPAFRSATRERRLLIPADAFYEWQKRGRQKQPFLIELTESRPFAFAGLWERWASPAGPIESCTILTTTANELLRPLHERMPVILSPIDYARWLDPANDPAAVQYLLEPYPAEEMQIRPIGDFVNSPRHEGPQCIESPTAKPIVQKRFFD